MGNVSTASFRSRDIVVETILEELNVQTGTVRVPVIYIFVTSIFVYIFVIYIFVYK